MATQTLRFLKSRALPFCKGCGHHHVAYNLEQALQRLGLDPLDVIVVTDIGCHGILDKDLNTHTVHGLHGRSVALGAGIAMALDNPRKKVIVMIGDGGATLGSNHLIEAANRNVPLTVIIHNNMLYGMTGGQPSGLTPEGFHTRTTPEGKQEPGYRIAELLREAGAPRVWRVVGLGDYSGIIEAAVAYDGFAAVEVLELCTAYAVKFNPGLKLKQLPEELGLSIGQLSAEDRAPYRLGPPRETRSLLEEVPVREARTKPTLDHPVGLVLSGSAGEGVQKAAELFALAAMRAGLYVSKKGSYPVTVGVGFSTAELILSPKPIRYTGIAAPDVLVLTSEDGVRHAGGRARQMQETGVVYRDETLPEVESPARQVVHTFRSVAGPRNAMLAALTTVLRDTGWFPLAYFRDEIRESRIGARIPLEKIGLTD